MDCIESLDGLIKRKISSSLPVIESGFLQPVACSLDRLLCPISMYTSTYMYRVFL